MEIKFKNGNTIEILKSSDNIRPKNLAFQFISIDLAPEDLEDMSCISYKCTKCNTIFETQYFKNGDRVDYNIYQFCPDCKRPFRGWYGI